MPAWLVGLAQAADSASTPFSGVREVLATEGVLPLVRVALIILIGFPLVGLLARWIRSWVSRAYSPQKGMIVGKLLFYAGVGILVVTTLGELGFSVGPLLGAAGILGIAIGFASQTSVSNIISGFFLIAEQPFVVDDVIQVGSTVGNVLSIDMMSVKLRTFDNRYVRIPNESIIKSEVINITRFPIRRIDVPVGVAYKEDVAKVRRALLEVAAANPKCLMEPEPMVVFDGYGESALNFSFRVWAIRQNWLALKNSIHEEIKDRFDGEGIEIPFPHRTLYAGLATDPFPVRLVNPGDSDADSGAAGPADEESEAP